MSVFFEKIMPNVVAYWDRFTTSCGQTLQMFAIAGVFTFIFGLIFGVILTVTKRDGIRQPKVGRNDPCPCGSGKKYKKCCGANA